MSTYVIRPGWIPNRITVYQRFQDAASHYTVLDMLCSIETVREILAAMTPKQFVVAALLIDNMTAKEIAEALGLSLNTVYLRRESAKKRIARIVPEVRQDVLSRSGPWHQ